MVLAERIVVPLDPESVRSIVGKVYPFLRLARDVVVDVAEDHIDLRVPRPLGLGHRRVRLGLRVYEFEDAVILIAKGERDSLIITLDIVDTGEGTHVLVTGSASGRVQKVVDELVRAVRTGLESRIGEGRPRVTIIDEDVKLASSGEVPRGATLVYYDSFTPVSNVVEEAVLRLLSMLGYDDYLVEVTDYAGRYLLRLVVRTKAVTGAYANVRGHTAAGEEAIEVASKPPGARVRVRAWSLTGRGEARIFEPVAVYESQEHRVYWLGFTGASETTVTPSQYLVVDGEEAALVGCGGQASRARLWRVLRGLLPDMESLRYIFASTGSPDNLSGLSWLLEKLPSATLVAGYPYARVLGELEAKPRRLVEVGERGAQVKLGSTELSLLPAYRVTWTPGYSIYDPASRILFTGPAVGAITPPGLWKVFLEEPGEARTMVEAYMSRALASPRRLLEWLARIRGFEVEALALSHGTIIRGRAVQEVLHALEQLAGGVHGGI